MQFQNQKFTNLIFLPLIQNVCPLVNNNCWSNPWHIICWSNHWYINSKFKIHEFDFLGIFPIPISLSKVINPIFQNFPYSNSKFKFSLGSPTIYKSQLDHIWTNSILRTCQSKSIRPKLIFLMFKLSNHVPCFCFPKKNVTF